MAMVHDDPEGSGPAAVIVSVVVLLALVVVLFYGLAALHWFGFDSPTSVGTAAASASASP